MPATHVALLRGINVGKAKRIAMADLRAAVEALGYTEVRTLLNSGNVVFTAPRAAKADPGPRIERAVRERLGVASRVTIVTARELAAIVADNTLATPARNPSRLMVAVLADPAHRERLVPLAARRWAPDALALGGRVAYVWCAGGILDSPVYAEIARAMKDGVTTRNWATMLKLAALVGPVAKPGG